MKKIYALIITLFLVFSHSSPSFADAELLGCLGVLGAGTYASIHFEEDEWHSDENRGEWTSNLNFFFGAKNLSSEKWEPVKDHGELGVMFDLAKRDWPVSIAIDALASGGNSSTVLGDVKANTSELDIGIRKIFSSDHYLNTYLGGGLAYIRAEADATVLGTASSTSGNGVGYFAAAGVYCSLGNSANLGFDIRYSHAKAKFSGLNQKIDVGGTHYGLLIGYHW